MKRTDLFYYTDSDDQSVDSASSEPISTLDKYLKSFVYNIVFAAKNTAVTSDTPVQILISNNVEFSFLLSNIQLLIAKYRQINLCPEQDYNFDIESLEKIAGYETVYIVDRNTNNTSTAQLALFTAMLKQSLGFIAENDEYTVEPENAQVLDADMIEKSLVFALKQCASIGSFVKLNTVKCLRYEKDGEELLRTIDLVVDYNQHLRLIVVANNKTCADSPDSDWYERNGSFKKVKRCAFDITEIFRRQPQELARASIKLDENHHDKSTTAILNELVILKKLSACPQIASAVLGSKFIDKHTHSKIYVFSNFAVGALDELPNVLQDEYQNISDIPTSLKYKLLLDITSGLQYAHANTFIHRDISSSNILLFRDLNGNLGAKLSDFGKALLVTEKGQSCGKYEYAGPEVFYAQGNKSYYSSPTRIPLGRMINEAGLNKYSEQEISESKIANQKDDIWALGIVAAELFSDFDINYSIVNEHSMKYGISLAKNHFASNSKLILTMLENKRCERPSAEEIVTRIDQIITNNSSTLTRKRTHDNNYESRQLKQFIKLKR